MSSPGENKTNTIFIFTHIFVVQMGVLPVGTASQQFTPVTDNTFWGCLTLLNVGLNSQFSDGSLKKSAQTENVLFSIRSATKQALQWIRFLSFCCPSESLSPRWVIVTL